MTKLEIIQMECPIWRPFRFENVIANWRCDNGVCGEVQIPGVCTSKYPSGPSLFLLADVVAEMIEVSGPFSVGLHSCTQIL